MRLIALFKQPPDTTAFEEAFFNRHLPLLRKVPGLDRVTTTRASRTLLGESFYMMVEMSFTGAGALDVALKSPEMNAAGKDLQDFAAGLVSLMVMNEYSPTAAESLEK
jgi:uncharacterized protein (TIGR02118 family)